MSNTKQNKSMAGFYSSLVNLRSELLNTIDLGTYLKCPDVAMIEKLDNAARTIAKHLDTYKIQVSEPVDEYPDIPR